MDTKKATDRTGHNTYPVNDNEHITVRIYRTISSFSRQLEMKNTNLETLKAEINAGINQKHAWPFEDDEIFVILDDLFTRVDLLKCYVEELV